MREKNIPKHFYSFIALIKVSFTFTFTFRFGYPKSTFTFIFGYPKSSLKNWLIFPFCCCSPLLSGLRRLSWQGRVKILTKKGNLGVGLGMDLWWFLNHVSMLTKLLFYGEKIKVSSTFRFHLKMIYLCLKMLEHYKTYQNWLSRVRILTEQGNLGRWEVDWAGDWSVIIGEVLSFEFQSTMSSVVFLSFTSGLFWLSYHHHLTPKPSPLHIHIHLIKQYNYHVSIDKLEHLFT